ncbi:hypothetical protein NLU13_0009 [Sarocladium strictum]|uniref:CBM1 domain-containing protein n=1 Tax=Sarocladium strictum TaxID=5046 RepID=A0AA39GN96_SARSR|nr:hypothetical protein NLU13_0009 [Sarocladium strictum]
MKTFTYLPALLGFALLCQAHMEMSWPPPFRSRYNRFTTDVDYNMIDPLRADGSNFPCKGYHSVAGSPQGQSVVTWEAGQGYNLSVAGTAVHDGGSCQASLSYDGGQNWKVIQSFHGGCPLRRDWAFTVPGDAPTGDALFAWTWFNKIGNREMYMNCAKVTISKPRSNSSSNNALPFSQRPNIFTANINNGCSTVEGYEVVFPNPGPAVSGVSNKPLGPQGNCGGNPAAPSSSIRTVTTSRSTSSSRPAATTSSQSPVITNQPSGAVKLWGQCGGAGWKGSTQCESGAVCNQQSQWYHQCIPAPKQPTTTTKAPVKTTSKAPAPTSTSKVNPQVAPVWAQCGGVNWKGPTRCASGLRCHYQSQWYSQCIPA